MAQRRMISKKIVDTDAFLDMPPTGRLLYYDLLMRADDDGFVSNPRKIMRMTLSSQDDMKILITKEFIIPFETGVCVVKHWRVHNLIRADRYTETEYKTEKETLQIVDNKYVKQNVIPHDNQMEPQVRLGKVRIGKVNTYSAHFSELWNKYPNSVGKKKAYSEYRKSVRTDKDRLDIEKSLFHYLAMLRVDEWRKPKDGERWFKEDSWRSWIDYKELTKGGLDVTKYGLDPNDFK